MSEYEKRERRLIGDERVDKRIERAKTIKAGDECMVQGNKGIVEEVTKGIYDGEACTYIKVNFDNVEHLKNTSYNHGIYGSCNWAFDY